MVTWTQTEIDYIVRRSRLVIEFHQSAAMSEQWIADGLEKDDPVMAVNINALARERRDLIRRLQVFIGEVIEANFRPRDLMSYDRMYELELKHFARALQ